MIKPGEKEQNQYFTLTSAAQNVFKSFLVKTDACDAAKALLINSAVWLFTVGVLLSNAATKSSEIASSVV